MREKEIKINTIIPLLNPLFSIIRPTKGKNGIANALVIVGINEYTPFL